MFVLPGWFGGKSDISPAKSRGPRTNCETLSGWQNSAEPRLEAEA
jgi:hypothetical protein